MTITSSEANQAPDQKRQSTRNSGLPIALSPVFKLLLTLAVCLAGFVQPGRAEDYKFTTIAGVGGSPGSVNSNGGVNYPSVLFNFPTGLVVDSSGNLFVADTSNHTIRKITSAGAVTTFVGEAGIPGEVNATGGAALFNSPEGPAIDSAGNIYVADYNGHTIRKITSAGVVTSLAGVPGVTGTANGTGTAASFNGPAAVAVDSAGNVYVADSNNHAIRKVTSGGAVTTLAGNIGVPGTADGTGTTATFNRPRGIAVDTSGNLFVADYLSHTIRKVTSAGVVTTFAGQAGTAGSTDGTGTAATFNSPTALTVDSNGNVYVADQVNHTIRKITSAGVVTTIAGTAGAAGSVDGTGGAAEFFLPSGIARDSSGNLYVTDYYNQTVRKITPAGVVTTIAGTGGIHGSIDGSGFALGPSTFYNPSSLVIDGSGNIYVADTGNQLIRKIASSGAVTTVAGKASTPGYIDGTGSAANFNSPTGITLGNAGNLFVTDSVSHTIRQVTPGGVVTTFAGTVANVGSTDANGASASFDTPNNIAADSAGNLYVTDYNNHTIRKISLSGDVTTFAGLADNSGSADGTGTNARFDHPRGVAVDNAGNVYVSDTGNNTIRKISPSGTVTTLAGTAGASGTADGSGSAARFNAPLGIAVDSAGNVYVADSNNCTIRKISAAGAVTTIGGSPTTAGSVDGTGSAARFNHPTGVTVDAAGIIYIADNNNHTIRKGLAPGASGGNGGDGTNGGGTGGSSGSGSGSSGSGNSNAPSTSPAAGHFLHPVGMATDSAGNVYVTDSASHVIKKITSAGVVSIFAGKEGTVGTTDGTGTSALFNSPSGITIDTSSNLFVSDTGNATIRKITSAGVVTTLAGSTTLRGNADGTGTAATFSSPVGITTDSTGNIYVVDSTNATIRMITPAGAVTTLAGTATLTGDADGTGAAARFNHPMGIAWDSSTSILFVSDTYNNTIRIVTTAGGVVSTWAGSSGISGSFDGSGINALFNLPRGVTIDGSGGIYVADTGNNSIRRVNSTGSVFTVAGFPGIAGYREGTGSNALFNQPEGVTLYNGGLFIADTGNALVRQIVSNGTVTSPNLSTDGSSSGGSGGGSSGGGSGGGGGGGAPSVWFCVALSALGITRRFLKRAA